MLLIAVLAVPLALYAQHAREIAREQALIEDLVRALTSSSSWGPFESRLPPLDPPLRYFEYGSDDEETPR
jgi:hypothetical protein